MTAPVPIVVAGGINLDLVVRTPRLPRPGETVRGGDLVQVPGGKGANQAAAVARLGGEARLLALVGDDANGRLLRSGLAEDGISDRWLRTAPSRASGVALIAVADDGENSIIVAPGANALADGGTIAAAADAFARARVVMGQLEWPQAAVRALLAAAPAGAARILNASPAERQALEVLPLVDWLVVNETEARDLSGIDVRDAASAAAAGRQLRELGVARAVITLGGGGAVLAVPGGAWRQPAPRIAVVDTTAAGDAFVGGLAVMLAEGADARTALRFAVAAGSLACMTLGARTSLPSRAAVERMVAEAPAGERVV